MVSCSLSKSDCSPGNSVDYPLDASLLSCVVGLNMATVVDLLSLDNSVFVIYALCSAILLLKTILMAVLTSVQRIKHKVDVYY